MEEINIRRAKESDIPAIDRLLYQVHKVHSDVRPDLFKAGFKKYTDSELNLIIADDKRPVLLQKRKAVFQVMLFVCINRMKVII